MGKYLREYVQVSFIARNYVKEDEKNKELEVIREKKNQSYGFIISTKESNWVASKILSYLD